MDTFVVGGVVPPGSDAYRPRPFEEQCLRHLAAEDWVTLLGPRQHGKSSGLVRLRAALVEDGFEVALVDLQSYPGSGDSDVKRFLSWLVTRVRQQLDRPLVGGPESSDDLVQALEQACEGAPSRVIILLDEATRLHTDVQHAFYSQLRAMHTANRGGFGPSVASRLSFLFSGTFRPETVIDDDNSPFNVSRIVVTDDLTIEDVRALAAAVGGADLVPWADRAYASVGGQPYLNQLLLESVSAGAEEDRERLFTGAMGRLAAGGDGHLPGLLRRVAAEEGAEELLTRVLAAGPEGLPTPGDGLAQFLEVVGAAVAVESKGVLRLRPRNALYEGAFRASPTINADAVLGNQPGADGAASHPFLAPLADEALAWIEDENLRAVVRDLHDAAVTLANAGQNRLALTGLGSTYEGMLLAFVEQLEPAARETARRKVRLSGGGSPTGSPAGWTFEGLVGVAHASGELFQLPRSASDIIRDWRNLVHPAKARRGFQQESEMAPEVAVIAAYMTKLLQATVKPS